MVGWLYVGSVVRCCNKFERAEWAFGSSILQNAPRDTSSIATRIGAMPLLLSVSRVTENRCCCGAKFTSRVGTQMVLKTTGGGRSGGRHSMPRRKKPSGLLKIQKLLQVVVRARDGARKTQLGDVVGEDAVDHVQFGGGK